jgi:hypothetical protein
MIGEGSHMRKNCTTFGLVYEHIPKGGGSVSLQQLISDAEAWNEWARTMNGKALAAGLVTAEELAANRRRCQLGLEGLRRLLEDSMARAMDLIRESCKAREAFTHEAREALSTLVKELAEDLVDREYGEPARALAERLASLASEEHREEAACLVEELYGHFAQMSTAAIRYHQSLADVVDIMCSDGTVSKWGSDS